MLGDRPTEDSCSPASGVYTKKCVEVAKWSWRREEARARAREEKKRLSLRAPMKAQSRGGDFAGNVSQNNVKTAARPGV